MTEKEFFEKFNKSERFITGIYGIFCPINERLYIGKSWNVIKRFGEHKRKLKAGKHANPHLQRTFIKYGFDNLKFFYIEECEKEVIDAREKYYFELFPKENLFNVEEPGTPPAALINFSKNNPNPRKGAILSEETRKKITDGLKKYFAEVGVSNSARENMRKGQLGRHHTEEVRLKISKSNKGRHLTEEQKRKISEAKKGVSRPKIYKGIKLNVDNVREIQDLLPIKSNQDIAQIFNVADEAIRRIRTGQCWSHITGIVSYKKSIA